MNNFIAVRGAATVKSNTAAEINTAVAELLKEIYKSNDIGKDDIISAYFTLTDDISTVSPAAAARHAGLVPEFAALFCMQEAKVENGLPMCVRVLVNAESDILQRFVRHIYLGGAKALRPDLYNRHFQIAIDGPSGAGKTTIASLVAKRMNIVYLDTGAIYRAIAVAARNAGISPEDEDAVTDMLPMADIQIKFDRKKQIMYLGGEDVSQKIREHSVSKDASDISKLPAVRAFVTNICQIFAQNESIVMEGRDICGYVLPDAGTKIYLDAAVETRAARRYDELISKGEIKEYGDILADIIARDQNDMNRANAPLKMTEDAVYIDGTELCIEEVFEKILEAVAD